MFLFVASIMAAAIVLSCAQTNRAQKIIDHAIAVHGGAAFESAWIEFDFRNRHYTSQRQEGMFTYTRAFADTSGQVKDVLDNHGLIRYINGDTADITEERRQAYTNSVNSVIYFALLPYGLNDPAVRKEYIGERVINNKKYHEIKVTFKEKGGGPDYEDEFLYWFDQATGQMDYLAYTYISEGGGLRFREALRKRHVGGILIQDYINYKPADKSTPLSALLGLFQQKELEKVSEINLENVVVRPLPNATQ